jgi:hypothetical protein
MPSGPGPGRHAPMVGAVASVGVAWLVGLVALALTATPAAAQGTPDASCPGPHEFQDVSVGQARYAQTFTAQGSGPLVAAQVSVTKFSIITADWVVQIVAVDGTGTPTNTVLASTTVDPATVPDGEVTITATFATPTVVAAGQQYALLITAPGADSVAVGVREGDDCPGTLFLSSSQTGTFTPSGGAGTLDLVFTVFLPEPPPPPQPEPEPEPLDSAPPNAMITKSPNDKTKKKTATFEFTGTDARAISSFQCKLDSGAFAPCTSPHTVKVKKGKHSFQVRAIDQAGNTDPTPASDSWKVKKKKKN